MAFLFTIHINKCADQFKAIFLFREQRGGGGGREPKNRFMPTIPNLTRKQEFMALTALENCAVNREVLLLH